MPNLPLLQQLLWLTVLTFFPRKVNCQCNLTSEESKLDLNQYDPKTVLPSRGVGSSCAVMTRLALGGAWLTSLHKGDVLCPPQLPEVCYFIALNTSLTRNEGHKFCSQLGLTLWRPWSLKEEIIMKSIMNSLNVSELIINVKVVDRYTIMDMDGNHITHDHFRIVPDFTPEMCFYFSKASTYWIIREDCVIPSLVICSTD